MIKKIKSNYSSHSCIGLHYSGSAVTAVVVDTHHPDRQVQAKATVVSSDPKKKPVEAEQLLTQLKEQMNLDDCALPTALALGGCLYQTGDHHSDFEDTKQIDQTLRFDIEEEFMVDAEDVVLCYQIQPTEEPGHDMIVSLASRDDLQQLFDQFDQAGLDAHIAQPDLAAWISYLQQNSPPVQGNTICVGWAQGVLYTLIVDADYNPILSRSYLCPDKKAAGDMLEREIRRALVLLGRDQQPKVLAYHADHLNVSQVKSFADSLQVEVRPLPLSNAAEAFAIGAALSWASGDVFTDFRRQDLQPRTLVASRFKALYGLSAAVTVLLLAWALIMALQASGYKQNYEKTRENMRIAWQEVHPGERLRNEAQLAGSMKSLRNVVRMNAQGQANDMLPESAARVVFLVFKALDNLPEDFDLQINSIRTGADDAMVSGSVPSLADRAQLDAVIEAEPGLMLKSWGSSLDSSEDGRRSFDMSLGVVNGDGS